MKRTLFAVLTYMVLTTVAWGHDAVYFYNQGLESSLANRRIDYFSKALQLNPKLVEAYERRGFHYYYQRRFNEAIYDYSKVVELKPNEPEGYRMRGQAYLRKGNLDSAIYSLSRAIELNPKIASAYGSRAEAYRLKGMAEEAVQDATTAIHLRENERTTAKAYATRAKAYQQMGQTKLSDADFNRSFELDPRYAVIRYLASTASLESVRHMGLFGLIALLFVGIFQLSLHAPRKGS